MNDAVVALWTLVGLTGILLFAFLYWILEVIGYWKMFTKAGVPGWKSIIPIYNTYNAYKITWKTSMFWIIAIFACISSLAGYYIDGRNVWYWVNTAASLVLLVLHWLTVYKMAKAYDHGFLTAVGLFFFKSLFVIYLGFSSSAYKGAQD